jgi:hypothetical protein
MILVTSERIKLSELAQFTRRFVSLGTESLKVDSLRHSVIRALALLLSSALPHVLAGFEMTFSSW